MSVFRKLEDWSPCSTTKESSFFADEAVAPVAGRQTQAFDALCTGWAPMVSVCTASLSHAVRTTLRRMQSHRSWGVQLPPPEPEQPR